MTTDINNFIDIVRQKNGRIKIKHNVTNEGNIYKLLHDFGFRKIKLDNRRIYFRRQADKITPVKLVDIKEAFREFLEHGDFTNIPQDVDHRDILEWYYSTLPIKENTQFDQYLEDTLTETEAHDLRLQTDHIYKHKFEIEQLLLKFDEWKFLKTTDIISSYSTENPPLYYKHIGDRKFLVFNHWNVNTKYTDGFDCWIATYSDEKQIGNKKPLDLQDIRLGFRLDRDFPLIEQYLS